MTLSRLLGCMFFRGIRYYAAIPMSGITSFLIWLWRGMLGGLLLTGLLIWMAPYGTWNNSLQSIWFYVIVFLVGTVVINWLVWLSIIVVPLEVTGRLQPLLTSVGEHLMMLLVIGVMIIFMIVGSLDARFPRQDKG